jgi:TRAP-type C4-dicarboxylate transport system substrate-binding protein
MAITKAILLKPVILALTLAAGAGTAMAQEAVTLKVHHFLPPASTAHAKFIEPWCAKINKESNGKLKCQIYPSMQLGGTPPQLFDQAKDGVADIVWTLPGYQAGRFTVSEAFELPFMVTSTEKGSRGLWHYATKNAAEEFKGVKPILFHLHDGNVMHTTKKQVKTLEDFKGLKVRAPTRQSTKMVAALGATPVPMPLPQTPEALSKSVIDGAMIPWEVAPALKLEEIVQFHTEVDPSMPQISNAVFIFAMNPAKYNSLPPELKKVIDANSGPDMSAWVGKVFAEASAPGRKKAQDRKNTFYMVPASEAAKWQEASESVTAEWIKDVSAKGHDGKKLLQEAKAALK